EGRDAQPRPDTGQAPKKRLVLSVAGPSPGAKGQYADKRSESDGARGRRPAGVQSSAVGNAKLLEQVRMQPQHRGVVVRRIGDDNRLGRQPGGARGHLELSV